MNGNNKLSQNTKCPNCNHSKWDNKSTIHRLIQIDDVDGKKILSKSEGFDVKASKCENCGFVMLFWEPDRTIPSRKNSD